MAAADTAKLIASLTLKDGLTPVVRTVGKSLDKLDTRLSKTESRAFRAGQQIGTGIKAGAAIALTGVGLIATQVAAGVNQLIELEDVTTATNTVLKSTRGVAGQTADSVRGLAEQMENLNATMDDKVIQSGENLLLTFTNIRGKAFAPALQAALDLNTAMGGGPEGLQKTIIQVGKALNDPAKGFTALRRVGVSFTDAQVKQIKALQKSGDLLGAQQIILKELGTEFGGRFAAQGKTARGTIAGIGDAVEDLQKSLATAVFPTIQKVLPRLREALASPAVLKGAKDLGDAIANLFSDENINTGARIVEGVFKAAKDAAPVMADAARVLGTVITTAADAFGKLPPEIQALAVAGLAVNKLTGGLVTNIAGGLISAVISSFKGLMNVNAAVVNVNGPVGGVGDIAGGGGGGGLLGKLGKLALGVTIVGITAEAAELIHGAISPGGGLQGRTETNQLLPADQLEWPFGPKNTPHLDLGPFKNILGGDSAFTAPLPGLSPLLAGLQAPNAAQDASEAASQRRNAAFTSVPTNKELRAKMAELVREQKGAPPKQARAIGKEIATIQHRLEKRMTEQRQKIEAQTAALSRDIRGVSDTVRSSQPVVNVTVTSQTNVDSRTFKANLSRYTTIVNGKPVNATSASGV